MKENCRGDALVACNCSEVFALAQGSCWEVTFGAGTISDALHPTRPLGFNAGRCTGTVS